MEHTRWCHSMAGEEYARVYSWGHHPEFKGAYETASPCRHVDLPQTLLEPILTKRAINRGWTLRFNTRFLRIVSHTATDDPNRDMIVSEVQDTVFNKTYRIQSRFLFGCDGARSQVVRELGLPLDKKPGQGLALNVLVRADLTHLMANRTGNLHWVVRPDEESYPPWGWGVVVRMVKPWTEWMFIFLPTPGADLKAEEIDASDEAYVARVKEMIGDPDVGVELLHVGKWWINETVAERYSDGNVYVVSLAVFFLPLFPSIDLVWISCVVSSLSWR